MEKQSLSNWQKAVDTAEREALTADLPESYPLGGDYYQETPEGPSRHWKRVRIVNGNVGGRWAYWAKKADFTVVADTIFNGDASHFLGMLGVPFTGKIPGVEPDAWVLISPRMYPPPEPKVYEEKGNERYERSREVYDPATGRTTKLS